MDDGHDEEAVCAVGDTGKRVVPGPEGGEDAEHAAGLDAVRVGRAVLVVQVANAQQQEGEVEPEEEQEEHDRGPERAEEEDGCEDEPALQLTG